jgi:hypothetical protein
MYITLQKSKKWLKVFQAMQARILLQKSIFNEAWYNRLILRISSLYGDNIMLLNANKVTFKVDAKIDENCLLIDKLCKFMHEYDDFGFALFLKREKRK